MKGALEKRPTAQATSATAKPVTGSPVAASVGKAARAASSDRTARGGGAADAASKAEGMVAFARKLGTAAEAAGS